MRDVLRLRCALGCVLALLSGALVITADREITFDRLRAADNEPENWLIYAGTYRSLRYSPLDQINTANVHTLKAAWAFQTGVADNGLQSTPLVADGVMYLMGSGLRVFAINATTGRQLWNYRYEPRQVASQNIRYSFDPPEGPAPTKGVPVQAGFSVETAPNRGVALGHGRVYFGTQDNYVVGLDAVTGKEAWRTLVHGRAEFGCRIQGAPLLVKDLVIVGSTGGDAAHRGHLVAFDAQTGRQRWWFNVIPGPGEKGNETWEGDSWKYGGGAPWMTGSYDPELDLIYWGTSNAFPDYDGGKRKGDNLYTDSTGRIALLFPELQTFRGSTLFAFTLPDQPTSGR